MDVFYNVRICSLSVTVPTWNTMGSIWLEYPTFTRKVQGWVLLIKFCFFLLQVWSFCLLTVLELRGNKLWAAIWVFNRFTSSILSKYPKFEMQSPQVKSNIAKKFSNSAWIVLYSLNNPAPSPFPFSSS